MGEQTRIDNQNKISGPKNYKEFVPVFTMKDRATMVVKHTLDITDDLTIGYHTTLAGVGTQIWTHAFYKAATRSAKVLGKVEIGSNCYIGAGVVICAGVKIADNVAVGANATVSKDLTKAGLYVSQPLRYIEYDAEKKIESLGEPTEDGVYRKK